MKYVILLTLLLAIVYALSRVSRSAGVRKGARIAVRVAGYALAALSVLMVVLSFTGQEDGTFTMLIVSMIPAFGAWFCFRLYERSLALDQG